MITSDQEKWGFIQRFKMKQSHKILKQNEHTRDLSPGKY